jgi:hypothetical protein
VEAVRRASIVAVLAVLCACNESADVTQTIVWLDAEEDARDAMALLRVRADGPADDPEPDPTAEARAPKWPVKLVLAPKNDDPSRRFTLQVEALDAAGDRLMTVRFATGFAADESRYVKLMIHEACVQAKATCDTGEACNVWSLERAAGDLGRSARDPQVLNVTCGTGPSEPDPTPVAGAGGAGGTPAPMAGMGPRAGSGGASGSAGMAGSSGPCAAGYVQAGTGCVDVDECSTNNPCGDHGRCQNVPGDYVCQCETGFQTRAGTCVSTSDCQTNNGGCESTCDNSSGFAVCTCAAGEWLTADRKTCGGFGSTERVDSAGSIAPGQPLFAFDGRGDGLAVWTDTSLTSSGTPETSIWTRRYVAGAGFEGPVERVAAESGNASSPRLSLAANGRGVLVWIQRSSGDGDIWAAEFRDGSFQEPERIDEENTGSASDPALQLDANGDGFASWTQTDGSRSEVWVNRFSANGGWEGAESIETPSRSQGQNPGNGNGPNWTMGAPGNWGNWGNWAGWETGGAFGPRVAVHSNGAANVVWTEVTLGEMGVLSFAAWAARFDPMMERWQTPVALDVTGAAGMPDSQLFGKNEGLAVWARTTAGRVSIRASTQKGKAFDESVDIATLDSELTSVVPRVALSPLGQGAAIWAQYQTPNVLVWANRYDGASDTWSAAKELSSVQSTTIPLPQIAVDANGDGFAVWSEVRGTSRAIKAARLQSDAGFIGTAVLSSDNTATPPENSPVHIAVDSKGRAIAIWDVFEMGQYRVYASAFE